MAALLQWFGGVCIVVLAIAVLPWLRGGGMRLFHADPSTAGQADAAAGGGDRRDVRRLVALSVACVFAYRLAGWRVDAIAHAIATLATGGFWTPDASFTAPVAAQ